MDRYHIWCDLRAGVKDLAFSDAVAAFLDGLQAEDLIAGWDLERRKLGLGPDVLGEWHVTIETKDLVQLQAVFDVITPREGKQEKAHAAVWSKVTNLKFGLYRTFPDANRER